MEAEAKSRAGFQTGNLIRNITRVEAHATGPSHQEAEVGVSRQAPYGVFHHEGTGIFGSYKRPIVPATGNVLVFHIRGEKVFARSVKGQRANPFIREAFNSVVNTYAPARIAKLAHDIGEL